MENLIDTVYSIINFSGLYNVYDDNEKFRIVGENTELSMFSTKIKGIWLKECFLWNDINTINKQYHLCK